MHGQSPIECSCGSTNFEPVVVRRKIGADYQTEFVACVECRVMYFCPDPPRSPVEKLSPIWKPVGGPS